MNKNDNKLTEAVLSGKAVLFLGAGAIANSTLSNGDRSPLGNKLAENVYKKFYPKEKYENESLQMVSSMVNSSFGSTKLHEHLAEIFEGIQPSDGLKMLTKFKWNAIYTTNIDRALEVAYGRETERSQNIIPVIGPKDSGAEDINTEVSLYKLHGCISDKKTGLVFSLEEYATYKEGHLKLFNRLSVDLIDRPIIFIGYSMNDSNFQEVWSTITKYCKSTSLPDRYFFVGPNIKDSLRKFLESKNFLCYDYKMDDFAQHLLNLTAGKRKTLTEYFEEGIVPLEIFDNAKSLGLDKKYHISTNYYFPLREVKKPHDQNINFYKGAYPNWSDIKHNLDATRDLLTELINDFDNWIKNPKFDFWIITGRSGDGKSTLLKRFSIEVANKLGDRVLFAKSRASLEPSDLEALHTNTKEPLVVFVDNATDRMTKLNNLIDSFRVNKSKILIIGASRISDYHATNIDFSIKPNEYSIERISDLEIDLILKKLEEKNALNKLEKLQHHERVNIFKEKAERELIVALKEATSGRSLDEIIANEYISIKSDLAKKVYLHVCLVDQFRYSIPQSLLLKTLEIPYEDISKKVFKYTSEIIFIDEVPGGYDFLLRSRHSVIAEVVSRFYFNDDVKKVDLLKALFKQHIPSNPLDSSLIKKLYHHTTIKLLFANYEIASNCYDRLIEELPDDYHLIQQKALFLTYYTGRFEEAKETIKEALRLNPSSIVLHHTHGTILMNEAINEKDIDKSKYLLEEGKRVLISGARKYHSNVYSYHTLISYLIMWAKKSGQQNEKLIEDIQGLKEEASKKHPNDPLLLTEYGKISDLLEDDKQAEVYFEKAISINPRNMAARYLLARLRMKSGFIDQAFEIVNKGVDLNQDEVSLNRLRFEIIHKLDKFTSIQIVAEYSKYLSVNPRDNFIRLCYASYLYTQKEDHCDTLFAELRYSPFLGYSEKLKIMSDVNRIANIEGIEEVGQVVKETPRGYYLRTERFVTKTFVFLSKNKLNELRNRQRVRYKVLFNYLGAFANEATLLE